MKRSTWLRLIAVILIISMLAVPVSAATVHNAHSNYGLIGNIIGLIRDIIRDIFDDWFDDPGHDPDPTVPAPTPTEPVVTEPTPPDTEEPTDPSAPVETDPTDGVTYDILYDILIKQTGVVHSDWTGIEMDVDAYEKVVFEPYDLKWIEKC